MHSAYGTGAMAIYRRETRRRDSRPICTRCGRYQQSGLIDRLCNRCFDRAAIAKARA